MNKKQLIVAWVITAILCFVILFTPQKHIAKHLDEVVVFETPQFIRGNPEEGCITIPTIQWNFVLQRSLVILLIGSLLVYTLRDKKK